MLRAVMFCLLNKGRKATQTTWMEKNIYWKACQQQSEQGPGDQLDGGVVLRKVQSEKAEGP